MLRVAAAQIGSKLFDTSSTLERVVDRCREAAAFGVQLIVFPEALLGGYPKGLTFGATVGNRTDEGRDLFRRYYQSAIECPGPEVNALEDLSRELGLYIVIGIIERDGNTLYCASVLISPQEGVLAKHRKLVPTGSERLIWGLGDSSTMPIANTDLGRVGMAICWENYMPLYRQYLYNNGVQLWCAPTVDAREIWQASMRHIAYEGRCFVISPCQYLTGTDWPDDLRSPGGTIDGKSVIVSPRGEVLAGPAQGEQLLIADLDMDEIARGKFDLDVAGHYNRPDIFSFSIR
jgi:nitrilase